MLYQQTCLINLIDSQPSFIYFCDSKTQHVKNFTLILVILLGLQLSGFARNPIDEQPPIVVKKTTQPIKLDGLLDEAAWFMGTPATDFWEYFPSDTLRAALKTEVFFTYDDDHLYIAAKCYSPVKQYVIPSLRRDFRAGGNDNITFIFDTFNDRTNAFVFGTNPYGVLREALLSNGCQDFDTDWNDSWDNKWRGTAKIFDGYWTCELAIPFSTLRFKSGALEWRFNCYRFDTQSNTRLIWNRVPQNQLIANLAFTGRLLFEEPLQKSGSSVSVIPYINGNTAQDFTKGEKPNTDFSIGGDAKIALTPGVNLDLTANPDFSQVEVDQQVINVDRFEVFFPERRQFFLENADLFGSFGNSEINPFFSRRIGIAYDTTLKQNVANPILFGARLSGKLDNNWRVGFLNMQTASDADNDLPSFNYTVAAMQRKIATRSNIGAIFVNKQTFDGLEKGTSASRFNRVLGLDYNLASADNHWVGKTFYHQNFTPSNYQKQFAHGTSLEYRVNKFSVSWQHQWVGKNYNPAVGFVPRNNFFSINPQAQLYFYPRGKVLNQHSVGAEYAALWTPGYGNTDRTFKVGWQAQFANSAEMEASVTNEYVYLLEDFDPSRSGATPLPGSVGYNFTYLTLFYQSDQRPKFSYMLQPFGGEFGNGYRYGMSGSFTYRFQPYGLIALNYDYTYIDLPKPYANTGLFLIGPRIDVTFTRSLFLTTFFQYNNQIDNVNINARLQWRFAPVSDFFLVYTDNYAGTDFSVKNRAVVAKLTYWLNL